MILTRRQRGGLTWALCALVLVACSSGPSTRRPRVAAEPRVTQPATATRGVHEVRRGDTLYGIARQHGLDYRELARINAIAPPYRIYPGQKLRLGGKPVRASSRSRPKPTNSRPSTASTAPAPVSAPATPASSPPKPPVASAARPEASASGAAATAQPSATSGWLWPTEGAVLRTFQANDPARQGLKIGGQAGQPVRAARAGQVVYSGSGLVGYGELVIIKHDGGYLTAYGHNRKRLVAEGDKVKRGQVIAEMGRSGTDREMLHFEIRVAGKPTDPVKLLPRR